MKWGFFDVFDVGRLALGDYHDRCGSGAEVVKTTAKKITSEGYVW